MKNKIKNLSPELSTKYREWLTQQLGSAAPQYLPDGEIDVSAISRIQTKEFLQWLGEGDHQRDIDFEDLEDDEFDEAVRITELKQYDVITRYLLEQGVVTSKRDAHLLQFGVVLVIVVGYLIWTFVLQ